MTDNRGLGQMGKEEWAQAGRWPTSVRAIKKLTIPTSLRSVHFGSCGAEACAGGGWPRCAARASYLAVRARSRPQPPQTCLPARLPHSRTALGLPVLTELRTCRARRKACQAGRAPTPPASARPRRAAQRRRAFGTARRATSTARAVTTRSPRREQPASARALMPSCSAPPPPPQP